MTSFFSCNPAMLIFGVGAMGLLGAKLWREGGNVAPAIKGMATGGLVAGAFLGASSAFGVYGALPVFVGILAASVTRRLVQGVSKFLADDFSPVLGGLQDWHTRLPALA